MKFANEAGQTKTFLFVHTKGAIKLLYSLNKLIYEGGLP